MVTGHGVHGLLPRLRERRTERNPAVLLPQRLQALAITYRGDAWNAEGTVLSVFELRRHLFRAIMTKDPM
jgi:hypothetical protein